MHLQIASTLPHFADCFHTSTLCRLLYSAMPTYKHFADRSPLLDAATLTFLSPGVPVPQVLGMVFSSSDFNAFLETVTVLALNTTTTLMPGLLGENLLEMPGGGFEIQIIAF